MKAPIHGKSLRTTICVAVICCFTLVHDLRSQPIPQYELTIQNPILIDSVYQFDIYVKRLGTSAFRIGNSQFVLMFNTGSFASPKFSRVPFSEKIGTGFFFDEIIAGDQLQISLGGNGSYRSAADVDPKVGARISSYRISGVNVPGVVRRFEMGESSRPGAHGRK